MWGQRERSTVYPRTPHPVSTTFDFTGSLEQCLGEGEVGRRESVVRAEVSHARTFLTEAIPKIGGTYRIEMN